MDGATIIEGMGVPPMLPELATVGSGVAPSDEVGDNAVGPADGLVDGPDVGPVAAGPSVPISVGMDEGDMDGDCAGSNVGVPAVGLEGANIDGGIDVATGINADDGARVSSVGIVCVDGGTVAVSPNGIMGWVVTTGGPDGDADVWSSLG